MKFPSELQTSLFLIIFTEHIYGSDLSLIFKFQKYFNLYNFISIERDNIAVRSAELCFVMRDI